MVSEFADYVVVMRLGKVVEEGECKSIFNNPQHDYTKELISAKPQRGRSS